MEREDPRLQKKPLLFLVGEHRRDIIPISLARGWVSAATSRNETQGEQYNGAHAAKPERRFRKRDGRTGELLETEFMTDQTRDPSTMDEESVIQIDELEVYSTQVKEGFEADFQSQLRQFEEPLQRQNVPENAYNSSDYTHTQPIVIVVVVFSPSASEVMLKCLGFINEDKQLTTKARTRRRTMQIESNPSAASTNTIDNKASSVAHNSNLVTTNPLSTNNDLNSVQRNSTNGNDVMGIQDKNNDNNNDDADAIYLIATIGPTTRDYLRQQFGFEADVCAKTPTPRGLEEGIEECLMEWGLV